MPYSLRKNQPVPTLFGVPVGGSGGVSSKNIPPPSGGEDDPETRAERRIGIPYDEWNFHTRRYRRGHVSVIEERAPVESRQLEPPPPEVMRWFCKSPTRAWHRKLDDGTDLDLDAYVDQYCATVAGEPTIIAPSGPTWASKPSRVRGGQPRSRPMRSCMPLKCG